MLHPQVLAQLGLAAALHELAEQHTTRGRLVVHTDVDDVGHPPNQGLLHSAARELLVNIDRHAGASHAWIILRREQGWLRLVVEDDGIGMSDSTRPPPGHLGLATHQIRVVDAGGTLTLAPGSRGTGGRPGLSVRVDIAAGEVRPPSGTVPGPALPGLCRSTPPWSR